MMPVTPTTRSRLRSGSFALERFGYCEPGTAPVWATPERMWLDGELHVNTTGGMLSAGHTAGWGQIVEMVQQLRHEAGPHQINGVELLLGAASSAIQLAS